MVEPWMRGPLPGVHPMIQPLLFSFQQAREDLERWTDGLATEQLWARLLDLGPVGFHVRHAGRAAERLSVYLKGEQLTEEQLDELKREMEGGASREELLTDLDSRLRIAETVARGLDPQSWTEPRFVGRKHLPTTVGGLITHIAEHTQRHVGEAIVTAKVVRHLTSPG